MNVKERDEWLKAVGACLPDANLKGALASLAALDAAGAGRWEVSVRGGGLQTIGLRFFGEGPYAPWRAACAKAFALDKGAESPRAGIPWLTVAWDLKTGARTNLRLCGEWDCPAGAKSPERRAVRTVPFKEGIFKEPVLDAAVGDFSRLAPIATMTVEDSGWSLRLQSKLRWPLFARCDVSAAFTPSSSQLALFMLDRNVVELSFDGEALWAHCAG